MLTFQFIISRCKIYFNIPYQLQRKIKSQFLRDLCINLSLIFKPKIAPFALNENEIEHLNNLNATGWTDLGLFLDDVRVTQIYSKLNNFKLKDRYRPEHGKFSIESVPADTHVADYDISNWNDFSEIVNIANSPEILKLAEGYLGCQPTISNMQLWWSFPGHEKSEEAENFHRDVDDWKFIKLFIYLTDVDIESGPHVYVQKSINSHRHLPIKRYNDASIEKYFGPENIKTMVALKGSAFMEDTFGFHKGQLAKNNRRLVLQVQYSINPIAINSYACNDSKMDVDPYINRLYLKRRP
jgi:hypothetical protein